MAKLVEGHNPAILKWARERSGYTVYDVARKLHKAEADINSWESGDSAPTYVQLEKLAYTVYKIPMAVFFFSEPPDIPDPAKAFRTLPDDEIRLLAPDTRFAVREGMAMQLYLYELNDGRNPAEGALSRSRRITADMDVRSAAMILRDDLGIQMVTQTEWRTTEDAFKEWRKAIQDKGIYVFKRSFSQRDVSGFSLDDDEFPIIYVNNSTPFTRQIFTLFHELVHLLIGISGITKVDDSYVDALSEDDQKIEVFCNTVAAEFLVPSSDFELQIAIGRTLDEYVESLSKRYHVSREVILRRLLDNGLATHFDYSLRVKEWNKQADEGRRAKSGGGNHYNTKVAYLGDRYLSLVFQRYYQGRCTVQEVATYLGARAVQVQRFEEIAVNRSLV